MGKGAEELPPWASPRPLSIDDPSCDWCGLYEDVQGPLKPVLCGDGSTMWLCEDCRNAPED